MTISDNGAGQARYRISVNGQEVILDQPQISVVELWAMFALDPNIELVIEGVGNEPDRPIEPSAVLDLDPEQPPHLFSRPPTSFG